MRKLHQAIGKIGDDAVNAGGDELAHLLERIRGPGDHFEIVGVRAGDQFSGNVVGSRQKLPGTRIDRHKDGFR